MCRNILIVDDDELIRFALQRVFEKAGFPVFVAKNGREALHRLKTTEIYAILLDYELPDLDGLSIYKILARHPELKKIPVLLMSGHNKLELISQAYEEGIPLFMRKKDMIMQNMPEVINTMALMKKYATGERWMQTLSSGLEV